MNDTLSVTFTYSNVSGFFEGAFPNGTRFAFVDQRDMPIKLAIALAGLRQTVQLLAEGADTEGTPAQALADRAKGIIPNRLVPRGRVGRMSLDKLEIEI